MNIEMKARKTIETFIIESAYDLALRNSTYVLASLLLFPNG